MRSLTFWVLDHPQRDKTHPCCWNLPPSWVTPPPVFFSDDGGRRKSASHALPAFPAVQPRWEYEVSESCCAEHVCWADPPVSGNWYVELSVITYSCHIHMWHVYVYRDTLNCPCRWYHLSCDSSLAVFALLLSIWTGSCLKFSCQLGDQLIWWSARLIHAVLGEYSVFRSSPVTLTQISKKERRLLLGIVMYYTDYSVISDSHTQVAWRLLLTLLEHVHTYTCHRHLTLEPNRTCHRHLTLESTRTRTRHPALQPSGTSSPNPRVY